MAIPAFRHRPLLNDCMSVKIVRFEFHNESDVALCVRRARFLGALVSLPKRSRGGLAKAVAHASRFLLTYGGGGTMEYGISTRDGRQFAEVVVRGDRRNSREGQIAQDETSQASLQSVGELVDLFRLDVSSNDEATVCLAQSISREAGAFDEEEILGWADILRQTSYEDALLVSQARMRERQRHWREGMRQQRLVENLAETATADETTQLLALVASKTDNAVIIMDADGAVTWFNDALTRMTGHALAHQAGKQIEQFLISAETDPDSVRAIQSAFRQGTGASEELRIFRHGGPPSWTHLILTPVFDDQGRLSRWIAVGSDITRRREAQEALASAKEFAEAANRAKSEFLANMSHEIRTPLNAVMGMTDLALGTELTGEQSEYLATVKSSAESLLQLLNDILDLSKIEAGRMEVERERFDLPRLLMGTVKAFAHKVSGRELELLEDIPADIPAFVTGDANRLRQVLVNLIGNAVKFTERGQVEVSVQKQWQTDDEVGLCFAVRDTGIGIPSDKLAIIFEAFTQADNSITRRFGGTGLGLTITAELLRLMGGKIWVNSQVGKGSTFHVSLRFPLAANPPTEAAETARTPLGRAAPPARSLIVLVADDHEANRILASRVLANRGHRCLEATNGDEVLEVLARERVDLVLLDIQMPRRDGLQTAREIRQRERGSTHHLPIIALTAHAMKGDRERCLEAGMDGYLSKPLKTRELVTLVESLAGDTDSSSSPAVYNQHRESSDSSFASALARLEGDDQLLREQMSYFLDDAPVLLEQLHAAVDQRDASNLRMTAHRLRSLVAAYDDTASADLLLQLETAGQNDDFSRASPDLSELSTRFRQLCDRIRHFLST